MIVHPLIRNALLRSPLSETIHSLILHFTSIMTSRDTRLRKRRSSPASNPYNLQPEQLQMTNNLDINLLPILRQDGQEQPEHPGLFTATPPRQATRSRAQDRVVIFLSMAGNAPLAPQQQRHILNEIALTYYKTSGATTSALKAAAETLNQYLSERNLRSSSGGKQCIGVLTIATFREDRVTISVSGPGHVFLITQQETQDLFDPQAAGRGLGLTRAIAIRFFQLELHHNDLMVFALQPPVGWKASSFKQSPNQAPDSLRRQILSQASSEANALIIQTQVGSGKLRTLKPRPPVQMAQPASRLQDSPLEVQEPSISDSPAASPPVSIPVTELKQENRAASAPAPQIAEQPPAQAQLKETEKTKQPSTGLKHLFSRKKETPVKAQVEQANPVFITAPIATDVTNPVETLNVEPAPESDKKPLTDQNFTPLKRGVGRAGQIVGGGIQHFLRGLASVLKRILPDESLFSIPGPTMAFIAIAIALTVATVGAAVYFQNGRMVLFQGYFEQAKAAATQAGQQTDPLELRTGWETTLDYLDRADLYSPGNVDSAALRKQAMDAIDQLDAIQRLNFQPIIPSGLAAGTKVIRIVATDTDVYLLNANSGSVMRAALTGTGYDVDPDFVCGSNQLVGPLIDIAAIPKGLGMDATIVGMDNNSNLLFCNPGEPPKAISPAPPQTGWGSPVAFALDSGDLYILDPQTNAVWIYRDLQVDQQPHLFFGEQIPFMGDVINLTVNRDDLYLLHADGHLTTCVYSGLNESPTRCDDPASYSDNRPGRQHGPVILDARFSQLMYTPPPDPSIYMLDPVHQAIYHFSLRMTLQRQFRAQAAFPTQESASAFTISPSRLAFIAVGNQVYSARLP